MLQSKELRGITEPKGRKQDRHTREITYTKPTKIEKDKMDVQCSTQGKVRYLKYIDFFVYVVYLIML
jgi:hypothetical protein